MPPQLVDQNSTLKRDVALAERKLLARNERIQNLEALLQDANEKVNQQNAKFEARLQAVRERLDQARGAFTRPAAATNLGRSWGTDLERAARRNPCSPEPAAAAGVEPQLWPDRKAPPRRRRRRLGLVSSCLSDGGLRPNRYHGLTLPLSLGPSPPLPPAAERRTSGFFARFGGGGGGGGGSPAR